MKVKFLRSFWGADRFGDTEAIFKHTAEAGFDGVETGYGVGTPAEAKALCKEYGLCMNPLLGIKKVEDIAPNFQKALEYDAVEITVHPGADFMEFDEGCRFFEAALEEEAKLGLVVAHEIHVNTVLFTPWDTAKYLDKFPELKLNTDYTNWSAVTNLWMGDKDHWLDKACQRASHIHARYSDFLHSLQIPDARAPEFAWLLDKYEALWDKTLETCAKNGKETFYVNLEWDQKNEYNMLPYTRQAVADIWDVILWQKDRLEKRWAQYR